MRELRAQQFRAEARDSDDGFGRAAIEMLVNIAGAADNLRIVVRHCGEVCAGAAIDLIFGREPRVVAALEPAVGGEGVVRPLRDPLRFGPCKEGPIALAVAVGGEHVVVEECAGRDPGEERAAGPWGTRRLRIPRRPGRLRRLAARRLARSAGSVIRRLPRGVERRNGRRACLPYATIVTRPAVGSNLCGRGRNRRSADNCKQTNKSEIPPAHNTTPLLRARAARPWRGSFGLSCWRRRQQTKRFLRKQARKLNAKSLSDGRRVQSESDHNQSQRRTIIAQSRRPVRILPLITRRRCGQIGTFTGVP